MNLFAHFLRGRRMNRRRSGRRRALRLLLLDAWCLGLRGLLLSALRTSGLYTGRRLAQTLNSSEGWRPSTSWNSYTPPSSTHMPTWLGNVVLSRYMKLRSCKNLIKTISNESIFSTSSKNAFPLHNSSIFPKIFDSKRRIKFQKEFQSFIFFHFDFYGGRRVYDNFSFSETK